MNKKIQHYAGCLLLVGTLVCAEGCGNKWVLENPPTEIGDTVVETVTEAENTETIAEDVTETEVVEKEDDISRWSAEEYSAFFYGEWTVVEYAGYKLEDYFKESYEEWYREEVPEWTEEVTAECMGTEFILTNENEECYKAWDNYRYITEDDCYLFYVTRFTPEQTDRKTPYMGVYIKLKDKDDWYNFIVDIYGTVWVEMKGCFFRLERNGTISDRVECDNDGCILI